MLPRIPNPGVVVLGRHPISCTLFVATSVVVYAACGGGDSKRHVVASTPMNVGAAGASITAPSGATLDVPSNALAGSVTIVASALAGVRAPAGTAIVATPLRFEPAGTTFSKPVEVTIPINPAMLGGVDISKVVVARAAQDGDVFVPLPTRRTANGMAVVAVTEHFSDFIAVIIDVGEEPFGLCGDLTCASDESCSVCPDDCGICVSENLCGNGYCEAATSEDCGSCEYDCGACGSGVCGDGIVDPAETCDTAVVSGTPLEQCVCDDGDSCTTDSILGGMTILCDVVCDFQPIASCGGVCGDGIVSGNELCDDGNDVSGDGCTYDCFEIEPGYTCSVAGVPCD